MVGTGIYFNISQENMLSVDLKITQTIGSIIPGGGGGVVAGHL